MDRVIKCDNCDRLVSQFEEIQDIDNETVYRKFLYLGWIPDGPDGNDDDIRSDYELDCFYIYCSHECMEKHHGLQGCKLTKEEKQRISAPAPTSDWHCEICNTEFETAGGCWMAQWRLFLNPSDEEEADIFSEAVFVCSKACVGRARPRLDKPIDRVDKYDLFKQ